MKIATWNVNSIRSRLHQLLPWLKDAAPDVVLLQELKCTEDTFPKMEIEDLGYNLAIHGQKTYNGVAILSKFPLSDIECGLAGDASDDQARYIEAVVSTKHSAIRVVSVYVPNGQSPDSEKFPYKLKFLERLHVRLNIIKTYDEVSIIGGDYNVAPFAIDVFDPAKLEGSVCYHPEERIRLRRIFNYGWYDAYRTLHPQSKAFSWWDYRDASFERDAGLRIDHLLLSPQATDKLVSCDIIKDMRASDKPSDHVPVMCEIKV
jgi:exodeoxyribonuclease-3